MAIQLRQSQWLIDTSKVSLVSLVYAQIIFCRLDTQKFFVETKVVVFDVLPNQWLTGITTGKTFLPVKHGKTEFLKKMCGK